MSSPREEALRAILGDGGWYTTDELARSGAGHRFSIYVERIRKGTTPGATPMTVDMKPEESGSSNYMYRMRDWCPGELREYLLDAYTRDLKKCRALVRKYEAAIAGLRP